MPVLYGWLAASDDADGIRCHGPVESADGFARSHECCRRSRSLILRELEVAADGGGGAVVPPGAEFDAVAGCPPEARL
jgi:hypothetical protein